MRNLKVVIDIDEVLAVCIPQAIERYNQEYNQNLTAFDILGWAGDDVAWTRYFKDPQFVLNQPVYHGAQQFIKELFRRSCDIIIMTSVPTCVVAERIAWIKRNFPEIKEQNIIIGKRKEICAVDVLIDDSAYNVLHSCAKYPILMRQPWNQHVTGVMAANGFDDCLNLIDTIMRQNGFGRSSNNTDMICLIGPSGSGKTEVIDALMSEGSEVPKIYTTAGCTKRYYRHVTKKAFEANMKAYAETTSYGNEYYGVRAEDLAQHMGQNDYKLVMPTDVCGANALMRIYGDRVKTVYLKRDRASLVANILKKEIPDEEKALRILALDKEERNETLCDYTIEYTTTSEVVAQILDI